MAFFPDFQYDFRSSQSTADLLIVVSGRIAWAYNRSGPTRAVSLNISKAFDRIWHAGLFHKLWNFRSDILLFLLLFLSNRRLGWFWMESLHMNIQLMLELLKASFLVLHFSYYALMTFLMLSVILLYMLMILLTTLSVIRHLICDSN